MFALTGLGAAPAPAPAAPAASPAGAPASPPAAEIQVVELRGVIHPISASYLVDAIDAADLSGAAALLIEIDTPGGLVESTKDIIHHIEEAKTPVIGYVAPSSARAASGGFLLLIACDVAAMAPGTNTGAAHPVISGGDNSRDNIEIEKMESDLAAFARTVAQNRGRDPAMAERGVRESVSWTEREALDAKLIDLIAKDRGDLLRQLDGRRIRRFSGEETVLHLTGRVVPSRAMSPGERLQNALVNPLVLLLCLCVAILGIYGEVAHPGAVFPAVTGGIGALLFLMGARLLPVSVLGLVLVTTAMVLFVLEIKIVSHGLLGIGGIVALTAGFLLLFRGPIPEMRLSLATVLPTSLALGGIMLLMVRLVVAARRVPVATGREGMVGEIGVAETDLSPDGKIFVHGEYWNARSSEDVPRGARVRVRSVDDMLLHVEAEGRRT